MKIGFYSGSFDPFTVGHKFVLDNARKLFDKVVIGIGVNDKKKRRFDNYKMQKAINNMIKNENMDNVTCIIYDNLTVDAAQKCGANFLVRGIRNGMDYERLLSKNTLCTMKRSTYFCAIPNPRGKFNDYKWPKLEELYRKLFNRPLTNAHDALADITASKECYFELKHRGII